MVAKSVYQTADENRRMQREPHQEKSADETIGAGGGVHHQEKAPAKNKIHSRKVEANVF